MPLVRATAMCASTPPPPGGCDDASRRRAHNEHSALRSSPKASEPLPAHHPNDGAPMKRSTAWVVSGALAVIAAALLVVFVLKLSSSPQTQNNLGDEVFSVGNARTLAPEVD